MTSPASPLPPITADAPLAGALPQGLTTAEAQRRLLTDGPNVLTVVARESLVRLAGRQFWSLTVLVGTWLVPGRLGLVPLPPVAAGAIVAAGLLPRLLIQAGDWLLARRSAKLLRPLSLAGAYLGLALVGLGCGDAPAQQEAVVISGGARHILPPPTPVAPLIQALLDTAAAGSACAADAALGLQAGAEVRALYDSTCAPVWTSAPARLTPAAVAALALLARAPEHGLRTADYGLGRLQALRDSLPQTASALRRARQQATFELYLSDAVLRFMRDVSRGRLRPHTPSARERAAGLSWQPTKTLRAALTAAGPNAPPDSSRIPAAMLTGQPPNREYRLLQQALAIQLIRWLTVPAAPDSAARHQAQYEQIAVNLERWRWDDFPTDSAYILINIPAYELQVVGRDSVLRRHRVIVGTPETPTPTLSSSIRYFTLAPDWRVPRSIATKEMLPRLQQDAGYLGRNDLALYGANGQQLDPQGIDWARVTPKRFAYTIRQVASCDNSLGNIVFRFANPYSVYVHDTPFRSLFARPARALSHGCIRLENPMDLAAWLLRRGGQRVQLPSAEECARQPRPRDVRLRRPMVLYVRYATCTAENGALRFLPDIYHLDEPLRRALFLAAVQ